MTTESRLAVAEEKIKRLEWFLYGAMALIITQMIAIIFLWIGMVVSFFLQTKK